MTQGPPLKSSTPVEPSANDVSEAVLKQDLFAEKPTATVKLPSANTTPVPPTAAQNGPTPPIDSKPNVSEALAPPAPTIPADIPAAVKKTPIAPKSVHIMPAVPILSPAVKAKVPVNGVLQSTSTNVAANTQASSRLVAPRPTRSPTKSLEDANRDASAAVAAAMAKLPPATAPKKQTNGESAIDNLTNKVNEMRTHDNIRNSKQPGTGGYAAGHRGGRGSGYRGGRQPTGPQTKRIEVPETDYDFAKANAKFNKQDLVKEAIATGSPVGSPIDRSNDISADAAVDGGRRESEHSVVIPAAAGYTKKSFFDNISSESKDRDDAAGRRLGGREFRSEEQKKNLETFGQGSVDGYRGGFRGRNRGRGYRGGRGRSSLRGRGAVAAES